MKQNHRASRAMTVQPVNRMSRQLSLTLDVDDLGLCRARLAFKQPEGKLTVFEDWWHPQHVDSLSRAASEFQDEMLATLASALAWVVPET
jgi:hypothetical protein